MKGDKDMSELEQTAVSSQPQSIRERYPFLKHPALLAVLAAIVALISSVVTSIVSSNLEASQFWRDKRLEVYSTYYDKILLADGQAKLIEYLSEDLDRTNYHLEDKGQFSADDYRTISIRFGEVVDDVEEARKAMLLLGGDEVRTVVSEHGQHLESLRAEFASVSVDLRDGKMSEAHWFELDRAVLGYAAPSSYYVLEIMRKELGIK